VYHNIPFLNLITSVMIVRVDVFRCRVYCFAEVSNYAEILMQLIVGGKKILHY
jgi:hypothetical protein